MSMAKTGDLSEIQREVKYEWKIKDFLQLSDEIDTRYVSSEFLFSGASWIIWIYPNGESRKEATSEGWVSVFVKKLLPDTPVTADYSLSLKTVDGKTDKDRAYGNKFFEEHGWGICKFILRSELIERKSELLPSGTLTVVCSLKINADGIEDNKKADAFAQTDGGTGILELQQHFKEILLNGNVSDVVLKVADQEFKSHRSVLAARSPVFLAMMSHDTKEKNSGVVDIPDIDPSTFSDFLNYLYTGSIENLTSQNVVKVYIAADKYQVDTLKNACINHMLNNLSIEDFCDFLTLSLEYVEKDLTEACSQFFNENTLAIVLTAKWQVFINENGTAGNELLIKFLQVKK